MLKKAFPFIYVLFFSIEFLFIRIISNKEEFVLVSALALTAVCRAYTMAGEPFLNMAYMPTMTAGLAPRPPVPKLPTGRSRKGVTLHPNAIQREKADATTREECVTFWAEGAVLLVNFGETLVLDFTLQRPPALAERVDLRRDIGNVHVCSDFHVHDSTFIPKLPHVK